MTETEAYRLGAKETRARIVAWLLLKGQGTLAAQVLVLDLPRGPGGPETWTLEGETRALEGETIALEGETITLERETIVTETVTVEEAP